MPQFTTSKRTYHKKAPKKDPSKVVKQFELQAMKKQVKRLIPIPERKFLDVTQAATIITSAGLVTDLFAPANGTGRSQLLGDTCMIKSSLVRYSITPNAVSGVNFLRVILVRDTDKSGTGAGVGGAGGILETASYLSPLNDDSAQSKRFEILFDRTYTVDTDANGAQVEKIYRKLNKKYCEGAAATVLYGAMYLLQISDQAANGPTTAWYSRVRFTDA